MHFLTHLQSAVIVLLVIIIYIQHDIINELSKSSSDITLLSSTSLPVIFSDRQQTQGSSNSRALDGRHDYDGVAVTLFLGSPKWFQDRYSMMVNQVIASIPSDWIVQIFFDPSTAMAVKGTQYAGIQKQVSSGRVVLTELPANMTGIKKRDLLKSTWLWENMLAETVLLFGGNGALCANSPFQVKDFSRFDYIGAPWKSVKGNGGSGDISMRKRSVVLQALRDIVRTGRGTDVKEDSTLVKFLSKQKGSVLANQTDTWNFAMTNAVAMGNPFAGVGILSSFSDEDRRKYLDYCPEMKMVFPSLHNPSCFGAETFPGLCFKSLCLTGGLDCHKGNVSLQFTHLKTKKEIVISITSFDIR